MHRQSLPKSLLCALAARVSRNKIREQAGKE
jgi:hypothetical protein